MSTKLIQSAVQSLKTLGYGIIPNYLTPETCQKTVGQINKIIQTIQLKQNEVVIYNTKHQEFKKHDYYLNSFGKIRLFFQEEAFQDGKLIVRKQRAINKIGHGLHQQHQFFKRITYSKIIGQVLKQANYIDPIVMQSMTILKPPKIGSEVETHQDATFLYDQPQSLMGFWIPLQNSTMQNGCLWGIPGSHLGKLYERSIMDWQEKKATIHTLHEKDYKQQDFIPLQMQKGSLIFFHGKFIHKSYANKSNISRYAYTWHLRDGSIPYPKQNWLQRTNFYRAQYENEDLNFH